MDWQRVIEQYRVRVVLMDLGGGTGFALPNSNGYTVLINWHLSDAMQRQVLIHELAHIVLGHCDQPHSVDYDDVLEAEVDDFLRRIDGQESFQRFGYD